MFLWGAGSWMPRQSIISIIAGTIWSNPASTATMKRYLMLAVGASGAYIYNEPWLESSR